MKISGEVNIKDEEKAIKFISSYENLIHCIPGVTEVDGKKFKAKAKIGFLTLEVDGEVKSYEFKDNESKSVIEVKGPGVISTISSIVKVMGNKLVYEVEYDAQVTIKGLERIVHSQAEKISREIIDCTKKSIDSLQ